jgi:hypothetical protein
MYKVPNFPALSIEEGYPVLDLQGYSRSSGQPDAAIDEADVVQAHPAYRHHAPVAGVNPAEPTAPMQFAGAALII